jgi:hypothetical protein
MREVRRDVVVSLVFASLIGACSQTPAQPEVTAGRPEFAVSGAKKAPTVKAAGRIRAECGGNLPACTGFNIVSVSSTGVQWQVTVDPSIDLSSSVVIVTPDTNLAVPSLIIGGNEMNVYTFILEPTVGGTFQKSTFSLLVF